MPSNGKRLRRSQHAMVLAVAMVVLPAGVEELAVEARTVESAHVDEPDDQERAATEASRLGLDEAGVAAQLYRGRARSEWVAAAGPTHDWQGSLSWPVDNGHWVRGYGSGAGHYHLAVDIAADPGNPVRAAAPGFVAYAGNDIDGYGKLVFLVHPGGAITMYAHNSVLRAVPGQHVAAGDVIAEVGSTGLTRGPHVHFELLYQGENCDPKPLFRKIRDKPSGGLERSDERVSWHPSAGPDDVVRCAKRRDYPD